MFYAENKSHIPNSPLREDIVREVNRYIGYVYADDFHSGDYITVNELTLEVGFWSRNRAVNKDFKIVGITICFL